MSDAKIVTVDGNEAVADVAYRLNEAACIYPITPSSPMGELADTWAARGRTNIWNNVPSVTEMQSEGGAAGAVHGVLQGGALATTFTSSQGLLLMIPNMYKIAGELTPFCMHVAARTVATHALSIFGDHSDVMACRQTGFAQLAASSVQEGHDFACIAQAASLDSRVPFMHFFDGFRTSHEIMKIQTIDDDVLRAMIGDDHVQAHRSRALTPDKPVLRGTAQNPDSFFQAREAGNRFYLECPVIVQQDMERFGELTGRQYGLFEYHGDPNAERIIVIMGSGAQTVRETVDYMNTNGDSVGVIIVRLYRPFSLDHFLSVLPANTKRVAVLDRTKEPGAIGEPLYLDVVTALREAQQTGDLPLASMPHIVGARYGLSSKEFTPAMIKGVYDELSKDAPKPHFTVGIVDDVTGLSIDYDESFDIEPDHVVRAMFYGLGSDGTVGGNKNTIKIIGEETDQHVQGYFVYDSKKSGAMTISHLRFSPEPIRSAYLIRNANFVGCHQFQFLQKYDVLDRAAEGAVFLLNSPYTPEETWNRMPRSIQEQIIEKNLKCYVINASQVARECGLGGRINTIMQACFFKLANVLETDFAIQKIKEFIEKSYAKKGDEVVRRNCAAVDEALSHLHELSVPGEADATRTEASIVPDDAPDFVKQVNAVMMAGKGDVLPVSVFPVDGTWPTGTTKWERRNIADAVPIWNPDICIQCNKCAMVCPHATIRAKVYSPEALEDAPEAFQSRDFKSRDMPGMKYTIQVAPEDCTGCHLCVEVCPAKDKANPSQKAINMTPRLDVVEEERKNYDFFLDIPQVDRTAFDRFDLKASQFLEPLFEYSGACAGCGETPYIKLMTQLFGDRTVIANATGCSSIYGGNLPSTPYTTNSEGRGPAWSNSLFEDNAEFGLGIRLGIEVHRQHAIHLLHELSSQVGDTIVSEITNAPQHGEANIADLRERVSELRQKLASIDSSEAKRLDALADYLVRKSVWIVGGDGWAFDIGYGGLDHLLSMTHDVNILVLDTEVYSNTGGQASKATPIGAAAKFASSGKAVDKKDLGLMAINYGHVYVASIAFGAKDVQTVRALQEADSYNGPSLVIAYSHCVAHGYDMAFGADQQKRAVDSGVWPLFRYDPRQEDVGEPPLSIDAKPGKSSVAEYMKNETRFRMVERLDPQRFKEFQRQAAHFAARRIAVYDHIAKLRYPGHDEEPADKE